jgi:hypothetical protein
MTEELHTGFWTRFILRVLKKEEKNSQFISIKLYFISKMWQEFLRSMFCLCLRLPLFHSIDLRSRHSRVLSSKMLGTEFHFQFILHLYGQNYCFIAFFLVLIHVLAHVSLMSNTFLFIVQLSNVAAASRWNSAFNNCDHIDE